VSDGPVGTADTSDSAAPGCETGTPAQVLGAGCGGGEAEQGTEGPTCGTEETEAIPGQALGGGCACALGSPSPGSGLGLLVLLLWARRRRS